MGLIEGDEIALMAAVEPAARTKAFSDGLNESSAFDYYTPAVKPAYLEGEQNNNHIKYGGKENNDKKNISFALAGFMLLVVDFL